MTPSDGTEYVYPMSYRESDWCLCCCAHVASFEGANKLTPLVDKIRAVLMQVILFVARPNWSVVNVLLHVTNKFCSLKPINSLVCLIINNLSFYMLVWRQQFYTSGGWI